MSSDTILVIDDSPTILKLVQAALGATGWLRVEGASDGETGLKAARIESPRLILLDDVLPDLTVAAFCAGLREQENTASIPVLVLRSGADSDPDALAKVAPVVDSIAKPFSPDAVVAVVSHILDPGKEKAFTHPAERPLALTPAEGVSLGESTMPELGGVSLAGDLAAIGIGDVLGLLQDSRQTGIVTVHHDRTRVQFFLRAGRLDFATAAGVADEFLLGRFLLDRKFVSESDLDKVLGETRKGDRSGNGKPGKRLGATLLERGLLTAPQLKEAMRLQTSALLFEVMRWARGRFGFERAAIFPAVADEAALSLSIDQLLMEGLRRVDEWRIIEREINDFDAIFVREDEKLQALGRGKLLREELLTAGLVNGRNTVKDIVSQSKMGSFDVSKILFRLLRGKLIRRRVSPTAV